jgi:hypothetical protein
MLNSESFEIDKVLGLWLQGRCHIAMMNDGLPMGRVQHPESNPCPRSWAPARPCGGDKDLKQ